MSEIELLKELSEDEYERIVDELLEARRRLRDVLTIFGFDYENVKKCDGEMFNEVLNILISERNMQKVCWEQNQLLREYLSTSQKYLDDVRLLYKISEECEEKLEEKHKKYFEKGE